jgi:hypothetical protein
VLFQHVLLHLEQYDDHPISNKWQTEEWLMPNILKMQGQQSDLQKEAELTQKNKKISLMTN